MEKENLRRTYMVALSAGTSAPDFSLPTLKGDEFSLREALARGPVVAAFFKISCPVCQYAFPFLERIYQAQGNRSLSLVGVSQNDKKATLAFLKEFGVTFPVLLDDPDGFAVSNAYGLTNVPTIFWIAKDGTIAISSVGWSRQDIVEISRRAAESAGHELVPLFEPEEQVADFRAG
jgi:peroxiredoxin